MLEHRSQTMLITGGGSGLGRDLCRYFAARGFRILVADINVEATNETIAGMQSGSDAKSIHLDVTRAADIDALLLSMGNEPIHILINNAGLQYVSKIDEFPPERWQLLIDVMLKGPALLMRALVPRMREQGYGRIVNIGSIHSLVASPFKSAYVAAKHGLIGLAKTIALETADSDITVNTICPSYIRTPLVEAQIASQAIVHNMPEDQVVQRIMLEPMPKRAFITTDEVAGAIEFLLSPSARNITGQTITIDGGWTAR